MGAQGSSAMRPGRSHTAHSTHPRYCWMSSVPSGSLHFSYPENRALPENVWASERPLVDVIGLTPGLARGRARSTSSSIRLIW